MAINQLASHIALICLIIITDSSSTSNAANTRAAIGSVAAMTEAVAAAAGMQPTQKQQEDMYEQWQEKGQGRGQQAPEGVFGSLHDLRLHTLRESGGANDASGRRGHHEGL